MVNSSSLPAHLIGAPLDLGAENIGVADGPEAYREHGIVAKLESAGIQAIDTGNVNIKQRAELKQGNPRLHYLDEIVRVNEQIAARTEAALKQGQKAIVLGGDHSIDLGAFAGASVAVSGDIGMIYFDAHGDMNTNQTTLSGNIHGMQLASLMGFGATELSSVHGPGAKLQTNNLLHIGGSDWDQAELDLIKRESITAFTLFDVLTKGLGELILLIDDLRSRVGHIWISLDLDSIDRMYAPAAGMPNPKGLTYREIATLAEYIGQTCNVIGIDVVEYNPSLDIDNKTAELGIELIARFLGREYSWYSNYMSRNQID